MTRLIFVYGSLKRGLSNSHFLAEQRFVGEACTRSEYRLFSLGAFPGMIQIHNGGRSIRGEVWEVDETCKRELDKLEDVDSGLYVLAPVRLQPPFEAMPVLTYLYARSVGGLRDAGDNWREA